MTMCKNLKKQALDRTEDIDISSEVFTKQLA